MEAATERREQLETEERERTKKSRDDPMGKAMEVIAKASLTKSGEEGERAKDPQDLLVFARAVNKVDSSLE